MFDNHYGKTLLGVAIIALFGSMASMAAQYIGGMNPCVMCIEQRLALMITALLAWMCLPFYRYAVLTNVLLSLPMVWGLSIAIKQLYIQSLPPMMQPPCGAPWTFRWRNAPLFDWYEPIIRGTGTCGEVYRFLGIPLAIWSTAFFGSLLLLLWGIWWRTRH